MTSRQVLLFEAVRYYTSQHALLSLTAPESNLLVIHDKTSRTHLIGCSICNNPHFNILLIHVSGKLDREIYTLNGITMWILYCNKFFLLNLSFLIYSFLIDAVSFRIHQRPIRSQSKSLNADFKIIVFHRCTARCPSRQAHDNNYASCQQILVTISVSPQARVACVLWVDGGRRGYAYVIDPISPDLPPLR